MRTMKSIRITNMFSRFSLIAALGMMLFVGCNSSGPTGTLQGKVTFDEKVVTNAKVQIQSPKSGQAAVADIGSDGTYLFEIPVAVDEYAVSITPVFDEPVAGSTPNPTTPPDRSDIPEKYRNGATSGFKVTLNAGENTLDVKMTGK